MLLFMVLSGGIFIAVDASAASIDDGFDPNANGGVKSIAIELDGKILVGGEFTTIGGQTRNRIARLNMDTTCGCSCSIVE